MTEQELKRDVRKYRKALTELTIEVSYYLAALDAEMLQPSNKDRGTRIAKLSNALDMKNDSVRHFTFGQSFESISRHKANLDRVMRTAQEKG